MAYQWYIVHVVSGHEKKVAKVIEEQARKKNLQEQIAKVVVPTEEVMEVRRNQKINVEKKFLPGYILINMEMNDETWHFVRNVPKVTGFLGSASKPSPVSESEVQIIFKQMEEGIDKPKAAIVFEVGESVKINDGPFESFVGLVSDVDEEKSRLKVSVTIFGRSTPVELEFSQVEKE
ncbi:MAG: transcription termination/antitermination protein NusG [Rickettsiales bacterium]|nr:transcription termination/antitermination protein NusG [Rickettsiales bacterium]